MAEKVLQCWYWWVYLKYLVLLREQEWGYSLVFR